MLDGDGSIDPGVLPGMAAVVAAGEADLAVGRRVPQAAGVAAGTPGPATP